MVVLNFGGKENGIAPRIVRQHLLRHCHEFDRGCIGQTDWAERVPRPGRLRRRVKCMPRRLQPSNRRERDCMPASLLPARRRLPGPARLRLGIGKSRDNTHSESSTAKSSSAKSNAASALKSGVFNPSNVLPDPPRRFEETLRIKWANFLGGISSRQPATFRATHFGWQSTIL